MRLYIAHIYFVPALVNHCGELAAAPLPLSNPFGVAQMRLSLKTTALKIIAIAIPATIALALPAFADSTGGTVIAFDRVENVIVLDDKTIWYIPTTVALPEDLVAGDEILIDYISNGDNGVGSYRSITRN
jgi:hypothetical protein